MAKSLNAARWKKVGESPGGWPVSEARYSRSGAATCTAHVARVGPQVPGPQWYYVVRNPDGSEHYVERATTERGAKTMAARMLRSCGIERG